NALALSPRRPTPLHPSHRSVPQVLDAGHRHLALSPPSLNAFKRSPEVLSVGMPEILRSCRIVSKIILDFCPHPDYVGRHDDAEAEVPGSRTHRDRGDP